MPKREVQRLKFTLSEFQISGEDDSRGVWSGYANTFGFLDNNYGGINLPGCFDKSIPEFLTNGFVPDSHGAAAGFEYTVLGAYGYPTTAREDNKGLYFEGAFHSDPEAQVLRKRMSERKDAGLSVGMSIGWQTTKAFRIFPKQYAAELPKYLAPAYLAQGLIDAQNWPSILIREECALIETSLTLTPANTASLVNEVNSIMETQGKFLDVDESLALSQISTLINELYYNKAWQCFCNEDIPLEARRATWLGCLQDFMNYNVKIFDAYAASESMEGPEDGMEDMPMMASAFFRDNFTDPKNFSTPAVLTVKELGSFALDVANRFIERATSLAEKRASKKTLGRLSGKVVSKPNWEAVKAIRDALDDTYSSHGVVMKDCIGKMDDFLEKFDPNAEQQAMRKRLESIAIRNQLLAIE